MFSISPNRKVVFFFILGLMQKGKKQQAETLLSTFFRKLQYKYKTSPSIVLLQAFNNIKPVISFRAIKLRGSLQKIPYFLNEKTKERMVGIWLFKGRKNTSCVVDFLIKEILEAFFKQGNIIKQRKEIYKVANQHKVFAHFRWFFTALSCYE